MLIFLSSLIPIPVHTSLSVFVLYVDLTISINGLMLNCCYVTFQFYMPSSILEMLLFQVYNIELRMVVVLQCYSVDKVVVAYVQFLPMHDLPRKKSERCVHHAEELSQTIHCSYIYTNDFGCCSVNSVSYFCSEKNITLPQATRGTGVCIDYVNPPNTKCPR